MRLPMDPSQWSTLIMRMLIGRFPTLEPHIQLVKTLDQDEEGNAHGIVPLGTGGAHIPFVIRDFEIKPMDTLIVIENGEERFRNLSEANALLAVGGIALGDPVKKLPPGIVSDQELHMLAPRWSTFGRRIPPMNVLGTTQPIKLAADRKLSVIAFEELLKAARDIDPGLPAYIAAQYRDILMGLSPRKEAGHVTVLDPRPDGTADLIEDGAKRASVPIGELAAELRGRLPNAQDLIAKLAMRDELVVHDGRTEKTGAFGYVVRNHDPEVAIREPGWHRTGGRLVRTLRTRHLSGEPATYWLQLAEGAHDFSRYACGAKAPAADSERLGAFYVPAELKGGELAFLLWHKSGEASVPFKVKERHDFPDGTCKLIVRPLLGPNATETLVFGNNQHAYRLGPGEIALPRSGVGAFKLPPRKIGDLATAPNDRVRVRIFKGGGTFSVVEDKRPATEGLTRGMLVAMLMHRYGLDPDTAIRYSRMATTFHAPELHVVPHETPQDPDQPDDQKQAAKLAVLLWDLTKKADGSATFRELVKRALAEAKKTPTKLDPTIPEAVLSLLQLKKAYAEDDRRHPSSGTAPVDLDPGRSGPNRKENGPAGPSGPGPVAMGPMDQGAAILPDIPFMREVSDTLTGFATGSFTPAELSEIYQGLTHKLLDIQDLTGRILTLARLGKIDFVTESEAKRILDEADRFRGTLLNADMLLKGMASIS